MYNYTQAFVAALKNKKFGSSLVRSACWKHLVTISVRKRLGSSKLVDVPKLLSRSKIPALPSNQVQGHSNLYICFWSAAHRILGLPVLM